MARSYMQQQIQRLRMEGKGEYSIYECEYLILSGYVGIGITVRAREKTNSPNFYGDGFHYIEIDYPWIPLFYKPTHRI